MATLFQLELAQLRPARIAAGFVTVLLWID
jgi:hypothetical protein